MSPKSAGLAKKWGWNNVKVYVEGTPAWEKAGHYFAASPDYVRTANIVLIDLRPPAAVSAGHIPRAVNLPAAKLAESKAAFPKSLTAPLVFYSETPEMSAKAVATAKGWGYKNVALLEFPGVRPWMEKGYDIKTGPAETKIVFERKLALGEISIPDFEVALKTKIIQVLDVRGPAEYAEGHFPGALNIALDELPAKIADFPHNKFYVVHCQTGLRGEMAYLLLKEKGYDVKYLKAGCKCNLDGTYLIWEL